MPARSFPRCGPVTFTKETTMQLDRYREPSKNNTDLWKVTLGEAAFGIAFLVLSYTAGLGYLTWYEIRE